MQSNNHIIKPQRKGSSIVLCMLIVCNCKFIFHMNVIHLFRKCLHIYVNVCAQCQIPQESTYVYVFQ